MIISGKKWGIFKDMFLGEYQYNLDDKGRVALPAKFRTHLKRGAIVTRGLDKCLFVFTAGEWQRLADKLTNLPLTQANSRAFVRLMLAGAMEVNFDKQGRVLVPDYLRQYAGIAKEVVVIGLNSRIEMWQRDEWERYKRRTEADSEAIAEKLNELGI